MHMERLDDVRDVLASDSDISDGEVSQSVDLLGQKTQKLKKELGLVSAVSLICGTIIGSGIFLTPVNIVGEVGSVGMALLVWVAAGLVVLLASLSYCELGTAFPQSGGEYTYLRRVFGGLPAFLYTYTSTLVTRPVTAGITTSTFARYVARPIFDKDCAAPESTEKMIAIGALIFLTGIGCISVKWMSRVQEILFFMKLGTVGFIIIVGFVALGQGRTSNFQNGFNNTVLHPGTLGFAFYDSFWAYDGWNNLNYVTGEMKNPLQMPLAIKIAIPLVLVVYLLTNIAYFSVLPVRTLIGLGEKHNAAIAVDVVQAMIGDSALVIIPLLVAASCFGAANGTLFTGARVVMESAQKGDLPPVLGLVHQKLVTPVVSMAFQAILAIFFLLVADLNDLILFFGNMAWLFFGLSMVMILVLRVREPNLKRPYKVTTAFPVIVLLASIFFVVAPFLQNPWRPSIAVGILLSGVPVYAIFVARMCSPKISNQISRLSNLSVRMVKSVLDVN